MKKQIIILVFGILTVCTAFASNIPQRDRIPDTVAYELIFMATAGDQTILDRVELSPKDRVVAASIIAEFNFDRQAHIDALNARHETLEQFQRRRDQLVMTARAQLHARLSKVGMTRFDAFVQHEKSKMREREHQFVGFES
jgi:hypothetical protein